jgi:serine/threonine-protein kinase SIK3
MESHYITHLHTGRNINVLPNTNLPLNIPLVEFQSPKNFTIKDQHLLKPPQVMGASNIRYKISFYEKCILHLLFFR